MEVRKIEKAGTSVGAVQGHLSNDLVKTLTVEFLSDGADATLPN